MENCCEDENFLRHDIMATLVSCVQAFTSRRFAADGWFPFLVSAIAMCPFYVVSIWSLEMLTREEGCVQRKATYPFICIFQLGQIILEPIHMGH